MRTLNFESWSQMIDNFTSSPQTTQLLKAKAMSSLAENSEDKLEIDRLENLWAEAIRLFEEEGHAHGTMDIRFQQVRRDIKKNHQYLTEELMGELKGYFESYEKANAVAPFQRAIETILVHMPPWLAFDLQISLANMRDELSGMAGARLDSAMVQVRLFASWLTHSGKSARVIEGADALDADIAVEDCRWLKGMISHVKSLAYAQLEDFDKSLAWATQAAMAWGDSFPVDRSEATRNMLQARLKTFSIMRSANMEDIIAFAEVEIGAELKTDLMGPAIQKMELVVAQVFSPRRDPRAAKWLDLMEQTARSLSEVSPEEGDIRTAAICQNRGLAMLNSAQPQGDAEFEEKCIAYLEESVALYMKHKRLVEAASTRQMQALALFSHFQKTSAPETLQRCLEIVSIARDAFRATDNTKFVATSTRWYSFFLFIAWTRGWVTGEATLESLKEAEEAWVEERAEMSIFASLEAVSRKQQLTSAAELRDTYQRAFAVCHREVRVAELWEWTQRAKARSLSDQLGVDVLVPSTLRDEVMREPTTKMLIAQEEALTAQIAASEAAVRLKLRGELHVLHQQMAEYPLLKTILDLKRGTPVTLTQICDVGKSIRGRQTHADVVFVDWIDLNGVFWVLTLASGGSLMMESCQLSVGDVAAWKRRWMDAEPGTAAAFEEDDYEEHEQQFCLRSLDQLVAPLGNLTGKGALLVFCPTGILHSIPLHALFVSDCTPIIARNPIVYSASLTVFWQCCRRAELATLAGRMWHMVGVYESAPGRHFYTEERSAIYDFVRQLAEKHGANAETGSAVTKAFWTDAVQRSAVFHFHGHCILDRKVLADQSLELADGLLPVRAVFNMKLRAPHITLVACDSASQGIAVGDEPLGLVTAFLCAGAGSVIGAIWPTASRTGRDFADSFYAELETQPIASSRPPASEPAGEDGGIFNLADAMRRAVLALRRRRDSRQPYHWAAFVLHGSWFMRAGVKSAGPAFGAEQVGGAAVAHQA